MSTQATPSPQSTSTPHVTAANRGRFVWHELMTPDIDAAQDFYKAVVGWSAASWGTAGADTAPAPYVMWMAGERPVGGLMALSPEAAQMGATPNWLAYVEVPDADATVEQVTHLGGSVIVPSKSVENVGRFAILRDPDGAAFAVLTSAMPLGEEAEPRPLEFSWHELGATDDVAALRFYDAVFGWEQKEAHDMGAMGIYRMFGRANFSYGGMFKKSPDMPALPSWLHYVRVTDTADAAAERAKTLGAEILTGPMEVPGGDRIAVIRDPQGAVFAVHSKP